ncbi:MAG: DUF2249 domain-containing protein [Natronomonas sp.]
MTDPPIAAWRRALAAPEDRPMEFLDVRELPPPEPLQRTLETVPELGDSLLLQLNDRAPKLLYPKLDDRGLQYDTVTVEEGVVTAIWR